ncbi:putative membrane protein YczE [Kineococcus xinjiangensis]|uniref:Putative membrane protein YczE n=1 Tax=Kineococcus xinjiangensis TaxID=512762 RepID=A0A2S6IUL5_9ACTN|nr:hypothetical protein [Kineococcus xinjiangensis]PPK97975.1 putative membrane protein YczE [Kineococcus xinjiangensis]
MSRFLLPLPGDRLLLRIGLLYAGLLLFGASHGLMLLAGLGVPPWDVLHQGLSRTFGLQVGTWSILVGAVVLLLWLPIRQRPGLGTVSNVLVIGLTINATLALVPAPTGGAARVTLLLAGVALAAVASGAYIGAGLGPGPRDGLSTGLAARGHSLRAVRTTVEVSALALGWLLGGSVGAGTVVFALAMGPLTHWTIPAMNLAERPRPAGPAPLAA